MSVKIIYFVHGTTTDNEKNICSGWSDVSLSDKGKIQAENLGKTTIYEFDELFTSDLIRAVESSIIAWPDIKKIQDSRLRECNYGLLDGKDKSQVIYENHIYNQFPNGESLIDVEKRIRSFLFDLKEKYDGKTIGIVAHRAPQLALEVVTKGIPWEEAIRNDWRKTKAWKPRMGI